MCKLLTFLSSAWLVVCLSCADTRTVVVDPQGNFDFVDAVSGNSLSKIKVGDTVRWVPGQGFHTTTSRTGLWDAIIFEGAPPFEYTFTAAGTYEYLCVFHEFFNMFGTVVVHSPGDVNGDGCADDTDLSMVLEAFGLTGNRPEDLNGDRIVDDADLAEVLAFFGTGC
ncbi:MAG: hypothetical protein HUU60_09475 [Armatimonadetes bacterium]|nr:hypothetical protein [Armatimonadota bacterium]